MSYTPLETKLRLEILANAPLFALLGNNVFGTELPQGIMTAAPPFQALTVQRISTVRLSMQDRGISSLAAVRMQFTSWCKGAGSEAVALQINAALVAFLNTFCATSTAQFGSPVTTPPNFPNFILNERITSYPKTLPPLYNGVVDARIYNREDL